MCSSRELEILWRFKIGHPLRSQQFVAPPQGLETGALISRNSLDTQDRTSYSPAVQRQGLTPINR